MQVTETTNEGLKRAYAVTVTADDMEARMQVHLKDLAKKIRLPGFRPGKAPPSLVRKLHGQALMGQILEETVNETTQDLIKEKELKPATRPNIEVTAFDEDQDLEFTMDLEVLPDVAVPDLTKIKLERLVAEATEKEVMEAVDRMASQQKAFKKAAKTYKASNGDAVLIDFVGRIDGDAFDGGAGEDFELELGSGSFIPGFEDQLVGVKAGDGKDVEVTFPAEYHSEALAGKGAVFEVTVKEVRKPDAVKVDDEFAKGLGLEDLAALKSSFKEQMEREYAGLSRLRQKRHLLDALVDVCDFDVPETMVEVENKQIWEQIKADAIQSGEATPEEFEGKDGPEDADERAEYLAIAERRVRLGLLLSKSGRAPM